MIIDLVYGACAVLLFLVGLVLGWDRIFEVFAEIWNGFMNGVCAITGSLHRALRRCLPTRKRADDGTIQMLEIQSAQWTHIRMSGGEPVWHEMHGWVALVDICPCGYVTECGVWCGPGHENGRCPDKSHGYPEIGVKIYGREERVSLEAYGITAAEFANRIRTSLRDTGGAL
jgi:hypothetical protein